MSVAAADREQPVRLSVSIVTYQQADTVAEALAGVLAQRTRFPFELVVGDDSSTDGTQASLRELAARAGRPVKLLLAERNHGDFGLSNYLATIDACRGEYIALLDGDDYWTDPEKLQCQVDFLDRHPECVLCAHRVEHRYDTGQRHWSPRPASGAGIYGIEHLLRQNFTPKIATVFRRGALELLPEWYRANRIASADWLFNLLLARHGSIGFLDRVMAVHRKTATSLTTRYGVERTLDDRMRVLDIIEANYPQYRAAVVSARSRVRWKQRLARMGPSPYFALQRLYCSPRPHE